MPAFVRAILIQESAEGGLSYKVKKLSNQRPISLWIPDYSVDALCISFSTL